MSTLPEQFSAARKSQVEAQINFFQNYASTAVQNAEKILALNLNATRASMQKSSAAVRQLLSAQDPRDLFALTTQTQENFESLLAYGRELFSIASGSQVALLKQAVPVIAPPVKEAPQAPAVVPAAEAPKAKAAPTVVEADPLPQSAPAAPVPVKAKPVAKAVAKAAPAEAPATPAAAPVPVAAAPVVVTGLKAVEAEPPAAEPKQLDMLAPKAKKKK